MVTFTLGCATEPKSQVEETENNDPLDAQKYYNEGFTLFNQGK